MDLQRTAMLWSILLTCYLATVGATFNPTLNVKEALGASGKVYYGQICEEGEDQICVEQKEFMYGMGDRRAAYEEDKLLYEQFLHGKLADQMVRSGESRKAKADNPKISAQCSQDLATLKAAKELPFNYTWAFEYQDADAKDTYPDTGALLGRPYALGSYDECVRIKATHVKVYQVNATTGDTTYVGDHNFNGHYCHTRWWNIESDWTGEGEGWCVPDSCNRDDVEELMSDYPDIERFPFKYTFCGTKPPLSSNTGAIITLCVVAFFVLLVVVATLFDGCTKLMEELRRSEDYGESSDGIQMDAQEVKDKLPSKLDKPGRAQRALLSFSLYRNIPAVLATGGTRTSFGCINGLRVIAMTWIVLGHTWTLELGTMMDPRNMFAANYYSMSDNWGSFGHQIINKIEMAVDIFFFLGATLVTYSFMKTLKRLEKQEPIARIGEMFLYVFHRYWRLTPLMAAIIMMYGNLWPYLSNGPLWPEANAAADNCRLMWWTNLLYINNLHRGSGECMGWTWYLANDFQFFLVVPIFAFLLYASPFFGPIFLFLGWLGTTIARAVLYSGPTATNDFYWDVYVKPWARFGPYALGIGMGHIIYKTRGTKLKIRPFFVLFGWLVAIGVGMLIVFGGYMRGDCEDCTQWSLPEFRAYGILKRDGFALCLAWLLFMCINGYGGLINSFLAWELWTPLSRLTYCGYLIHPIIHFVTLASREKLMYVQTITMLYWYLGNIILTFICSFILTLIFEVPFLELEKVILPSKKKADTPKETEKLIRTVSSHPTGGEMKSPPPDEQSVNVTDILLRYRINPANDAQISDILAEKQRELRETIPPLRNGLNDATTLPPPPPVNDVGVTNTSLPLAEDTTEFPPPPPPIAEDLVQIPVTSTSASSPDARSFVVIDSVLVSPVAKAGIMAPTEAQGSAMAEGTSVSLTKAHAEEPSVKDYPVAETRL